MSFYKIKCLQTSFFSSKICWPKQIRPVLFEFLLKINKKCMVFLFLKKWEFLGIMGRGFDPMISKPFFSCSARWDESNGIYLVSYLSNLNRVPYSPGLPFHQRENNLRCSLFCSTSCTTCARERPNSCNFSHWCKTLGCPI